MIPTMRLRRTVAALAVSGALLFSAACGSDDSEDSSDNASGGASSSGPVATVSGEPGKQPKLKIDKKADVGEKTLARVLAEGDGAEVAEGAFLRLDILAKTVQTDADLINTWAPAPEQDGDAGAADARRQFVSQAGVESTLPVTVTEHLVGESVGSRVVVEGRVDTMLGAAVAQQYSFPEGEGVVWVIDVVAAVEVNPTARAEGEQAAVADGMPEVDASGEKAAKITIPDGQEPPDELRDQVLIEGDGPEVEAGHALVAQYTGVTWADGKKFDSSWDRKSAAGFQIGTGSVVAGWDEGLVGKHVGDRVLLVIPPDKGYGEEGNQSIPGGSTLVFVVDILGVA